MRVLFKHKISAIIGFWRMGVDTAIIAAIIDCERKDVIEAIRIYQLTIR